MEKPAPMRIVILGPPGSGKGTQAGLIAARYTIPHVMPAELLHGDRNGPPASHENPLLDFATRRLRRKDASQGFIIDGFPRTIQHALALEEVLGTLKRPLQIALRIAIDADAMIQRLAGRRRCRDCGHTFNIFVTPTRLEEQCDQCGGSLHRRVDDTEEVIDNRLRVYENLSTPVVAYYRANGLLRDIPGDAEIETVSAAIDAVLSQLPGVKSAQHGTSAGNGRGSAARAAPKKAPADKSAARGTAGKRPVASKAAPAKKPVKKPTAPRGRGKSADSSD
jgi:adenylate kinase